MVSSRTSEIRFWWPLSLAVLIWLIIIWGFGFYLEMPKKEIAAPAPIEAHFLDLPESKIKQKPLPIPRAVPKTTPQVKPNKPNATENQSRQRLKPQPNFRETPQARPQVKPKTLETTKLVEPLYRRRESTNTQAPSSPSAEAPTDLSEYVKQARARRRALGIFDGVENSKAVTLKRQPSEDEIKLARIKRNLEESGTNGIFRIVSMGPRTAEFSFRAWTTGSSARQELIQVDAGSGGDIHLAIVRRMIKLIRQYHQGDFNWESHRLNSVVVLSARIENSQQLENFLMREFFSYVR